MPHNFFTTHVEFKTVEHAKPGTFTGYASVFGLQDAHGDVVAPGAFDGSMAAHKARGTMPAMYAEHSRYIQGGDSASDWRLDEDRTRRTGLRVEGKLIPLTAHYVRRIHSLLKEGALRGLSIAYHAPPGGAIYKRKAGEPKRLLKAVELHSIDIVRDTSNSEAQIDGAERRNRQSDH
jgi:HK97 family phage prohead protease